jgi:hypothetical protein
VDSGRHPVWWQRNHALRQVIHHQAELQSRQHDQDGHQGKHRGKPRVLKASLKELERPHSAAGARPHFVQFQRHDCRDSDKPQHSRPRGSEGLTLREEMAD